MKKLLYLAIILLGIGLLSSCDKIGGRDNIVGKWTVVTDMSPYTHLGDVWRFEKDGALFINGRLNCQYNYDAKTKILNIPTMQEFSVWFYHGSSIPEMNLQNVDGNYTHATFQMLD